MSETEPGERLQATAARLRAGASEKLAALWWWFLLRGLLAAGLALAALFWPDASLAVLVGVVGLYCLLDGAASAVAALRGDSGATWLASLAGIGAGAVLLFWPGVTLRGFLWAFGAWAIAAGASHLVSARAGEDAERPARTTLGWLLAGFGLVLFLWPGTGVVAIAWIVALVALAIAALLLYVASRLRRLRGRVAGED